MCDRFTHFDGINSLRGYCKNQGGYGFSILCIFILAKIIKERKNDICMCNNAEDVMKKLTSCANVIDLFFNLMSINNLNNENTRSYHFMHN